MNVDTVNCSGDNAAVSGSRPALVEIDRFDHWVNASDSIAFATFTMTVGGQFADVTVR